MAQHPIVWQPSFDCLPASVHIVDSLPNEGSFFEDVLINIRYGLSIWIDSRLAREKPCETRAVCAPHADANARLKDSVSFGHTSELGVVERLV